MDANDVAVDENDVASLTKHIYNGGLIFTVGGECFAMVGLYAEGL